MEHMFLLLRYPLGMTQPSRGSPMLLSSSTRLQFLMVFINLYAFTSTTKEMVLLHRMF